MWYSIRLSMTQLNLFAMIPTPWCVRSIHVSNGHKVFCHCHPIKQSESHIKLLLAKSVKINMEKKSYRIVYSIFFVFTTPLKVWKTLWTRYICGPSCFTAEKHHIQWHRIVQSKQVHGYVRSLYSKKFNWISQFRDISK